MWTTPPIKDILKKGLKILSGECGLLIQNKWFAQGTFNYAYAAKLEETKHKVVAKRPKNWTKFSSKKEAEEFKNLLKLDLKKKGIAISLAREYNAALKGAKDFKWARINFIHTFLFECGDEIYLLEGNINGKFEKYTNNLDEIDKTKEIRHFTAFAHFSYEKSGGEYLVTDFQGVGSFLLTDPSLHSKSKEFVESGDFGHEGFIRFFSKHQCNDICRALNLKKPSITTIPGEKWQEKSYFHDSKHCKTKCNAKFCNTEMSKGEKRFCSFCSTFTKQTKIAKCSLCEEDFSYEPYTFLLVGLFEPKKCEKCLKAKKRKLQDLFDASDDD